MRLDFNHIKPCWRLKDIICLHPPCCLLTHCLCHLGCKSGSSPVFKPDCFQYEWHILWWHNCCRVCRNCLKAKSSVQAKEKWQGYSYVKWMSKRHQLQDCKAQGLETWHFVLPLQSKPIFKSAKSWHWLQWNLILLWSSDVQRHKEECFQVKVFQPGSLCLGVCIAPGIAKWGLYCCSWNEGINKNEYCL